MTFRVKLILAIAFLTSCGTIIGNGFYDPSVPAGSSGVPAGRTAPTSSNFDQVVQQYISSTLEACGSFSEKSSISSIDAGRECIRMARETCTPSKYLFNKLNTDGSRFTSFVSVDLIQGVSEGAPKTPDCQIYVHTISNVPGNYIFDEATCFEFEENEIPEVACGILNVHS